MENISILTPPSTTMLPRKSTFWMVGMIFLSGFLVSIAANILFALVITVTALFVLHDKSFLGNFLLNTTPHYYALLLASIIVNVLGIRYGVNYVTKKSLVYPNDINKIALLIGIPYFLYFLNSLKGFVNPQSLILNSIYLAAAIGSTWYFLKQRVK